MTQKSLNGNHQTKRAYMNVNVILTFETWNEYGETQEFFDLYVPISKKESGAVEFIHNKLFKRIVKQCKRLNRSVGDLIKISTASNWDLFTEVTGLDSLVQLGHSCKWFFGNGRVDLDSWEKKLVEIYGFGVNADMSYINKEWIEEMRIKIQKHQETVARKKDIQLSQEENF